ncbi:class I SAM-dependent methyltransferase [Candidatus Woesearchaeota archaeon]|nr:class I SAM-dependent methyltransferase [Candidatus Woesearchaeota archaeon]
MYSQETINVQRKYDWYARFYDALWIEKRFFKNVRESTITGIGGKVLEIGVGTGRNLPYYPTHARVTAIDFSKKMLEKAKRRASNLGRDVDFYLMDAQNLAFPGDSFDYVVGTFVLCTIPDPLQALREVKRVMKDGGTAIFVEHVLSRYRPIGLVERLCNPLTNTMFGFNVNRDTRQNIIHSGLYITHDEELAFFDVLRRFTCMKSRR